jgi:hypothetical protein
MRTSGKFVCFCIEFGRIFPGWVLNGGGFIIAVEESKVIVGNSR